MVDLEHIAANNADFAGEYMYHSSAIARIRNDPRYEQPPATFKLTEEDPEEQALIHLVNLRDQLHGGNWDDMVLEMTERTRERPYIFLHNKRIALDAVRIEKLDAYEQRHGVNLKDHIREISDVVLTGDTIMDIVAQHHALKNIKLAVWHDVGKVIFDERYEQPPKKLKLNKSEKKLVEDRDEVYKGNWNKMIVHIRDKYLKITPLLNGQYKRAVLDLARIMKLREYEAAQQETNPDFDVNQLPANTTKKSA